MSRNFFTQRAHWRVFRRQIQRRAVGPSFPDGKGLAGCNEENTNQKHMNALFHPKMDTLLPSFTKYIPHQPNIKIHFRVQLGSFCFRIQKIHYLIASYPEIMGVIPSDRTRNLNSVTRRGVFQNPK